MADERPAILTAEEVTGIRRDVHKMQLGETRFVELAWWDRIFATLEALMAEVVYLRRQIGLDDNARDPEFWGCTPDPERPAHLPEMER